MLSHQVKLNPPTRRRGDFTRRRLISHCGAVFHPPDRADFVKKTTGRNLSFFLSMGYEKDIFAGFSYEFELLHILE